MAKHSAHTGFIVEVREGRNNWETHNFPSFCEMLDWFTNDELENVLVPELRQTAMGQIAKGTSFWALGTSTFKDSGYVVRADSVLYFFSHRN